MSAYWALHTVHLTQHLKVSQVQILLELLVIKVQQVAPSDTIALKGAAIPNANLTQQLRGVCH